MTICADVGDVMVDRAWSPLDRPLQRRARDRGRERETVVDSRFNLRSFFVVIPRHELQRGQLSS